MFLKYCAVLGLSLVFLSCLTQVGKEDPDPDLRPCLGDPLIRLNDLPANDSQNLAVVSGFRMYVSAKTDYNLRVKSGIDVNSRLFLVRILNAGTSLYPKWIAPRQTEDGYFNFTVGSRSDSTELVWGIVRNDLNGPIFKAAQDVKLVSGSAPEISNLAVNFYKYGNIPRTLDSNSSDTFIKDSLFAPMSAFLESNFSITPTLGKIDTLSVQGASTVQITNPPNWQTLIPNANKKQVHIVLVNAITDTSGANFLGFAPLNGFSQNVANFLVIEVANNLNIHQTILHEMGHHFGLRHNRATTRDMLIDRDLSNIDDGFENTPACNSLANDPNFAKPQSVGDANKVCYLRKLPAGSPALCGQENLMFFASDSARPNLELYPDQIAYFKSQMDLMGFIH